MNPVEEFLMEKQALDPNLKAALTMGAITAGTTALAAVGASQMQSGIQAAHDAVSRSIAFKKMMSDSPSLKKMEGKKARRYFNTLYNASPEVAKDPFAAASWVKQVEDYDYVDPQSLNTLASTSAKIRERRGDQLLPAFNLAQGAVLAGIGERARLMDSEARQAELETERQHGIELENLKGRRAMKQEAIKQIAGLGRDMASNRRRARERFEDQAFNLAQEARASKQKRWESTQSPKAYGVSSPGEMQKWKHHQKVRGGMGPMEPLYPDTYPGYNPSATPLQPITAKNPDVQLRNESKLDYFKRRLGL